MSSSSKKYRKQKQRFIDELSGDMLGSLDGVNYTNGWSVDNLFAKERARLKNSDNNREKQNIKRSCISKNRYVTKGEAMAAAEACAEYGAPGLSCYKCEYCKGWHLTSHPWEQE